MKTKLDNPEKNIALLEFEIDEETFKDAMTKAFNKNKNRFTVPGFRKGKAPWPIVQRFYGESVLFEDIVESIYPDAYKSAVKEHGIEPVAKPELDVVQIGGGKPFIFTIKVATKPEVEIDNYFGIEIEKSDYPVTDEDVLKEISREREKNARIISVDDRAAEEGDICVIDYEGFMDGVAFDGGKGENYELTLGSGRFIPGFEDQLIGKNPGDEFKVNVIFPEDYNQKDLAGKEAEFDVKIHEIKIKELPEPDDEFAKDISEFDTMDEYKKSIYDKLVERNAERAQNDSEAKILKKISELAQIDIPKEMIEARIDDRIFDFDQRLKYQGMDFNAYMAAMGMDIKTFRSQMTNEIVNEIKVSLALEEIAKKEDIRALEEEVTKELEEYAKQSMTDLEKIIERMTNEHKKEFEASIKTRKVIKLLVDQAVFVEKAAEEAKEE